MQKRMELVEARRLRGFSQDFMAKKLGIHRHTYAAIEKNPENCSIILAVKICEILQMELQQINFFDRISTKCRLEGAA